MLKRYIDALAHHIATVGPVGYLPAPGTCGTIAAIPLLWAMRMWLPVSYHLVHIAIVWIVGAWCINRALPMYTDPDPSEFVIDEVVGFFVAMYGFVFYWKLIAFTFIAFRIFDIAKPLQIDQIDMIPGAWGIILDDVVAGAFAHIVVAYVYPWIV